MDLTATTAELASAASDLHRLVPGTLLEPVLSGLLLTATPSGVRLTGNDRERAARIERSALVHTEGTVLVPAKPFADTLRALDEPRVRLVVEGTRLALRTPSARYALPLLEADLHPGFGAAELIPVQAGTVAGEPLASALATVTGAASRDDALPMFTGVRVRADGDRLVLLATDGYRLALARLPWEPHPGASARAVDALVPASLLGEIAKQTSGAGRVTVHAGRDLFGLSWAGDDRAPGSDELVPGRAMISTAVLDGGFLHESKVSTSHVDTWLELSADALAGAVRRVALYADARGVVRLEVGDSEVRVCGADQRTGEAEETVKATVHGGRTGQAYQARYLTDALRPFAGGQVQLAVQPGMRATVFSLPDPDTVTPPTPMTPATPPADRVDLRYLAMPMLPPR